MAGTTRHGLQGEGGRDKAWIASEVRDPAGAPVGWRSGWCAGRGSRRSSRNCASTAPSWCSWLRRPRARRIRASRRAGACRNNGQKVSTIYETKRNETRGRAPRVQCPGERGAARRKTLAPAPSTVSPRVTAHHLVPHTTGKRRKQMTKTLRRRHQCGSEKRRTYGVAYP